MDYIKISTKELLEWLKKNLNEERYEHSLGTADCAKDLAQKYNLNSGKAYIAGLLHDCAKCFSTEKLLSIIEDYHLDVEDIEKIVIYGYCTDICVISNAMVLRAAFPETEIEVLSDCCAGVTPQSHQTALDAMRACQFTII